jgi:hypothetical protein
LNNFSSIKKSFGASVCEDDNSFGTKVAPYCYMDTSWSAAVNALEFEMLSVKSHGLTHCKNAAHGIRGHTFLL